MAKSRGSKHSTKPIVAKNERLVTTLLGKYWCAFPRSWDNRHRYQGGGDAHPPFPERKRHQPFVFDQTRAPSEATAPKAVTTPPPHAASEAMPPKAASDPRIPATRARAERAKRAMAPNAPASPSPPHREPEDAGKPRRSPERFRRRGRRPRNRRRRFPGRRPCAEDKRRGNAGASRSASRSHVLNLKRDPTTYCQPTKNASPDASRKFDFMRNSGSPTGTSSASATSCPARTISMVLPGACLG